MFHQIQIHLRKKSLEHILTRIGSSNQCLIAIDI